MDEYTKISGLHSGIMEQKPPRPRTLNISPPANKKCVRPSRQRRHGGSRNASELRMLANNIKEIIHDLSFQPTSEDSREKVSRRYIGISRSATYENQPRFSRRNIVSAYYDENRDGSAITRESGMHLLDRVTTTDRYNRGEPEDKATKRQSCPWDLSYFGQHEDRSLQILASELHHLREVREKEVTDLLKVNNKLQHNLFEADREISTLQQKSDTNEKRLDAMLNVYEKIRGNLKMCLGKVRDLEVIGSRFSTPINSDDESRSQRTDGGDASSGFNIMSSDISECLSLGATALGYEGKGDGEGSVCEKTRRNFLNGNDAGKDIDSISIDSRSTGPRDPSPPNNQSGGTNGSSPSPDHQLLGRLQADVDSLSQVNSDQSQEIERLRLDLSSCRKHVMSTQYQLEAVEIECSRLLAMEDQLVSVITLLRRARQMHIHRQILGDVVLSAVVTSDTDDEDAGIPADVFIRNLREFLSSHPVLSGTKSNDIEEDAPRVRPRRDRKERERKLVRNSETNIINDILTKTSDNQSSSMVIASDMTSSKTACEDRAMYQKGNEPSVLKMDGRGEVTPRAVSGRDVGTKDVLDLLRFIDDEEDQPSETESNRSSSKRLVVD